jgi:hypothetical protein
MRLTRPCGRLQHQRHYTDDPCILKTGASFWNRSAQARQRERWRQSVAASVAERGPATSAEKRGALYRLCYGTPAWSGEGRHGIERHISARKSE